MRKIALIIAPVMIVFLLNFLKDGISAEQVEHHGQMVLNDGSPNDCIVCHDGLIATDAHYCTVECGFGTSHSIYKDYPPRLKESSYAPVKSLRKKGIRLFSGKVSCVSCHDLNKNTDYHLIMDNSDSVLCFSCHNN